MWILLGGLLFGIALTVSWYPYRSPEASIYRAVGPVSLTEVHCEGHYPSLTGSAIVFYHQGDDYHHAWLQKRFLGWRFRSFSTLPKSLGPGGIYWTAWSPDPSWTLIKGKHSPEIKRITVNGGTACMHKETSAFWFVLEGIPELDEITIHAYNKEDQQVYEYPGIP